MRSIPALTVLSSVALLLSLQACGGSDDAGSTTPPSGSTSDVGLLETTDLHTNVLSYDYFKLAADPSFGVERVATLIKQARAKYPNNLLLDAGDIIQGTALADYQALVKPVGCDQPLAIYKAMNALHYDASTIGNHEFNYGLPFLNQVSGTQFDVDGVTAAAPCQGPSFPQVLANVTSVKSGQPLFKPYVILTKQISVTMPDKSTATYPLHVGIIGFTPPTIMAWDKRWLDGKVTTQGLKETAEKYVPQMRAEGADVVVAVSHGGLDNSPYSPTMENGNWWLSQVPGIDAMLIGHSHQLFPNPNSTVGQFNLPGVDKVKGTVNGVPTVMANLWGKNLGIIDLHLSVNADGHWQVDRDRTVVSTTAIQNADKSYVEADPAIAPLVADEHNATIQYVKTPIGTTDYRMTTYFADVGEVGAIEIVNQAQAKYVADYIAANLPQYQGLPVLSVSAPFKSGFAGGSDFTDVAQGNVAINNAADLYLYPNTVYAVKVKGSDIQAWLETAAQRFNQIDPASTADQQLVSTYPGYNFDMFTSPDISYQIDVTQPVGSRIKNLTYKGAAIDANADFIVATNNYRASGGGSFPGLDGSKTIYASPDANRDVLISYIKAAKTILRSANGADRSWHFAKVHTAGRVLFKSAPNMLAVAQAAGLANVSAIDSDDGSGKNLADYAIDLSQ